MSLILGAGGVSPVLLIELSPGEVRGTFRGLTYQLGNLISAGASQIETTFATHTFPLPGGGADYAKALAVIMLIVFSVVALITAVGKERRGVDFATD